MKPGLTLKSESQEEFIAAVKKESPGFLQTKLEDLKTEIQHKLQPQARDTWDNNRQQATVYLAATAKDVNELRQLVAGELAQFNCRLLPE